MRKFVIFGASGDLTSRYLLPALARLLECGQLPADLSIEGIARSGWSHEEFREHVREKFAQNATDVAPESRDALLSRLSYAEGDVADPDSLRPLLPTDEPIVAYLALPPAVFAPTIKALAAAGLADGSRIVVEKPFGEDVESARELNRLIGRSFPESVVFRLDHFLGKQTVQNVLGLRFANRIFEPIWNRNHVERVDIVWDETIALEDRAGYYDVTGAARAMLQNHLLQLTALLAMEPPATMGERDLRDRKAELMRAVHTMTEQEVSAGTVRGRYIAGEINGHQVPSYTDERGVDPTRNTETFAQVTLTIDNWRWADVPFTLRSGKALGRDRREMVVHLRKVPHLAFDEAPRQPGNTVVLAMDPDTVAATVNINGPGDPFSLECIRLQTVLAPQSIPAYGRLLLDVIEGDPVLSIRDDEAEEAWRILEPVLAAWERDLVPLEDYRAGSTGPVELCEPEMGVPARPEPPEDESRC